MTPQLLRAAALLVLASGTASAAPPPAPLPPPAGDCSLPVPLSAAPPAYPAELLHEGIEGRVVLRLWIDEAGAVREAVEVSSPHPVLARAARQAALRWRFSPSQCGGRPAPSVVEAPVAFRLAD